jgi:hypothetical protein
MTFARTWTPAPKLRDREPPAVVQRVERAGVYSLADTRAQPVLKDAEPVRDEDYRRWVASLPCYECRIQDFSQCAHPNSGKAKGRKNSDDGCFPMCCDRPGIVGCHSRFDRYELVSRADMPEYERRAAQWTREQRRLA